MCNDCFLNRIHLTLPCNFNWYRRLKTDAHTCKILVRFGDIFILKTLESIEVGVQRDTDIRVTENMLEYLRLHSGFYTASSESVPQGVQGHLSFFIFIYNIIFLYDSLKLHIHLRGIDHFAFSFEQVLAVLFTEQYLAYEGHYRRGDLNDAVAVGGFRTI